MFCSDMFKLIQIDVVFPQKRVYNARIYYYLPLHYVLVVCVESDWMTLIVTENFLLDDIFHRWLDIQRFWFTAYTNTGRRFGGLKDPIGSGRYQWGSILKKKKSDVSSYSFQKVKPFFQLIKYFIVILTRHKRI